MKIKDKLDKLLAALSLTKAEMKSTKTELEKRTILLNPEGRTREQVLIDNLKTMNTDIDYKTFTVGIYNEHIKTLTEAVSKIEKSLAVDLETKKYFQDLIKSYEKAD